MNVIRTFSNYFARELVRAQLRNLALTFDNDRAAVSYKINRSQQNRLIHSRWFSTLHITNLLTVMHVHSTVEKHFLLMLIRSHSFVAFHCLFA